MTVTEKLDQFIMSKPEKISKKTWVAIEDAKPKDCESLIGIEMPYEARYACHR